MHIFFNMLAIVFAIVALITLLSYAIYWYESANLSPQLLEQRFAPRRLLLALRLLVSETLLLFVSVVLHPLGWIWPKEKPTVDGGKPPIILLHGLFHNRSCWWWLKWRLKRAGYRTIYSLHLSAWHDIEVLTELIAKKVDRLRLQAGVEQVILIGHSMGGILARNYIQRRGGAARVAHCIQLGTPNGGSKLAPFAVSPLARNLLPGSTFLAELNASKLPSDIPLTSIYSRHDNIVIPAASARLNGSREIELQGMGHMGLLYKKSAVAAVLKALEDSTA
ncbi:alpha/beta fold hydrolase [Geothermobacter hydrogeniphilus]|nr:alpha/beta fold hydrolase [Geothermobacter hydrogeniphilus]